MGNFRVWDSLENQMLYNPQSLRGFVTITGYDLMVLSHYKMSDYMIMVGINILDTNGVEIYEGDIIMYQNDDGHESAGIVYFDKAILMEIEGCPVKFRHDDPYLTCAGKVDVTWSLFRDEIKSTIIGNIYENNDKGLNP